MSCHVRDASGDLEHYEFLAEGPDDPRPAIAQAVVRACEGAQTVVAYNASFERGRLVHLAENVPSLRTALLDVADRLVDLLPIVRDHVYHPDFGGSFSLKSIAPALVSGLGYEDLEIGEGSAASTVLEALLLRADSILAADRAMLRQQLMDYCERDTLATVKVYERLVDLVRSPAKATK
jgi:predicted RecB family nuclease